MKYFLLFVCLGLFLVFGFNQSAEAFKDIDLKEVQIQAEKGDPAAQTRLGVAYSTGINVEKDKNKAAEWYRKAAEQGYASGQWNLAFLYIRGEGVEQDDKKARELFQKAAEQEFPPAEYDLGVMYLNGFGGKRSRAEALKWLQKSADHGYREAISFLKSRGEYKEKGADKT